MSRFLPHAAAAALVLSILACAAPTDQDDGVCDNGETHDWRCSADGTTPMRCDDGEPVTMICQHEDQVCAIGREDTGICVNRGLGTPCASDGSCEGGYHCDAGVCRQRCVNSAQCVLLGHTCRAEEQGPMLVCKSPPPPSSASPDRPSGPCCKRCNAGQPCGDSCIARDKVCNVRGGCAC